MVNKQFIKSSTRLEGIGEYYFSKKLTEIAQLNAEGKNIINLGIGSPDLPPHPNVVKELNNKSILSSTHAYQSYKGSLVLRKAIADWYKKWYKTDLNPDEEILPLIGSKEGIMHICMTFLNYGDIALVPNPGYPTYTSAVQLAGGTCLEYELDEANEFMPNLKLLEENDLSKVKLMWVNYPHMPTGANASDEIFENIISFGIKHNILICHDNPYSFILNDNPRSLLAFSNAKNHVIELNSLSKSHNMAGWRIGMMCSNSYYINEVLRFKSNMDSGMFLPLQLAAVEALSLDANWYNELNEIYNERRKKIFEIVEVLNCSIHNNQSGLFVWAKIPSRYKNAYQLSDEILYNKNVFITPGGIFGTKGNKFVRISLCQPIEILEQAKNRIL